MKIGIIGAGQVGATLAQKYAAQGHSVLLANSRGPETIKDIAREAGATAVPVTEAVKSVEVVIISIPEKNIVLLPEDLFSDVSEAVIVVDTGNYYPARDGSIREIENGLTDSEWVAQALGRLVIKAFNNIVADSLKNPRVSTGDIERVCLSVAGDDEQAKEVVQTLIEEIGFDTIDAGCLADSWRQQPGTPAYCRDLDTEGLKAALAEAEATKIAHYRAEANESARSYFL